MDVHQPKNFSGGFHHQPTITVIFSELLLFTLKRFFESTEGLDRARCVVYVLLPVTCVFARLSLFIQAMTSLWRGPRDSGVFLAVDYDKHLPQIRLYLLFVMSSDARLISQVVVFCMR